MVRRSSYPSGLLLYTDYPAVTAFGTTCNIQTNTSVATRCDSCASFGNLSSLSLCCRPHAPVSNTAMPTSERTPCLPWHPSISTHLN